VWQEIKKKKLNTKWDDGVFVEDRPICAEIILYYKPYKLFKKKFLSL